MPSPLFSPNPGDSHLILSPTQYMLLCAAMLLFSAPSSSTAQSSLDAIDSLVEVALQEKKMPGCVVLIGHGDQVLFEKAYGHNSLLPKKTPMKLDTVFDLASLTKPIATATSIMILVDQKKLKLDDPVSKYLPRFAANGKSKITIKQLMTHVSGLIPDNALADYKQGPKIAFEKIDALKPRWTPGTRFAYSDVGFIVLAKIVEKLSGKPIDKFASKHIFTPLKMSETMYNPTESLRQRAAVTQMRNQKWMRGEVHDPRAFELDGVAGHAGLFSTARDLAVYSQMMSHKGKFGSQQILTEDSWTKMTAAYSVPGDSTRGLGWDKQSGYSSNRGKSMSKSAFGHGGFTGTALWIDPELDLYVIFLSNRVHPDGKGSVNRLAGAIGTVAADFVIAKRK